jgi:hypothetical protein
LQRGTWRAEEISNQLMQMAKSANQVPAVSGNPTKSLNSSSSISSLRLLARRSALAHLSHNSHRVRSRLSLWLRVLHGHRILWRFYSLSHQSKYC